MEFFLRGLFFNVFSIYLWLYTNTMEIPNNIKDKFGPDTKFPANAERILKVMVKMEALRVNADKLLVQLSYESLASIILGEVDLKEYGWKGKEIRDKLYEYSKLIDNDLPKEENEYEEFYYIIELGLNYNAESVDFIDNTIYGLREMEEMGKEVLTNANNNTRINEFKRYT